jgi:hypothetical protein
MSAILYRFGSTWVLEARFPDSYHIAWRGEFKTAKAAREHAKRYKLRVRRADRCDSPGD